MSWDASPSRFTDAQYARSAVLDRGASFSDNAKERYGLPVREPDGTLNCDAVANARARFNQVKGAPPEALATARRKLEQLAAQCAKNGDRSHAGEFEVRELELSTDGKRIRGVVPYATESRDLGGFTEVIEPGALRSARLDDLVLTVDHAGVPLARYPGTLSLSERSDGLHWSAEPPVSRADVVEAIERGDLNGGSWRMRVGRDEWRGNVRHVHEIAELADVSVVTRPSYNAPVELRNQPEEPTVSVTTPEPVTTVVPEPGPEPVEARSAPDPTPTPPEPSPGLLRVESRAGGDRPQSLAECFRSRGFPGEHAVIPWSEFEERAITWSASVNLMNQQRRIGVPLPLDQRYAWPAFPREAVDASDQRARRSADRAVTRHPGKHGPGDRRDHDEAGDGLDG
jgi:HK97 family phage prohead protease